MRDFSHFAAVDWSGAAGEFHRGIAVAIIGGQEDAPTLLRPDHRWSRGQVLEWIITQCPPDTLIGFDMGQSLPFADAGAFFPQWPNSPPDARSLWAMVDSLCAGEPHLGVNAFVDHAEISRHFRRHGNRQGDLFPAGRGRMRVTELAQAAMGANPTSNFSLVGAAQVGKGSLAGMRLFHRLPRDIAIWPMDPLPPRGKVVVEIYTTIAAMAAGRSARASKIRDWDELARALFALGCRPADLPSGPVTDHAADAMITAAWLRTHSARPELWRPKALTPQIALTEGWTFGAV
ncbi:hypothetical protein EOE18_08775 [Novosphingobium umbonatum]|uniref:DUF429 domain-containing protein n=1 Tax=Novosphingobium umbonatum TaxID=1908524 RepID=A0A437N642_9SPHN|nr:hypothetical protein [Novosphingobium umbonatum]RVU05388.1 hypothetical protein EOE18_08775 [Novosphingobium umbonatum]